MQKPVCEGAPPPLPSAPCPGDYFHYSEQICGPTPGGDRSCSLAGDQLCHQVCTTDADCSDPCRPYCRTIGLYAGGDYGCNRKLWVCSASNFDQCS
ncbi:MAG: hypothetical protein WDO74_22480 [Pseudomonadota bacterium]